MNTENPNREPESDDQANLHRRLQDSLTEIEQLRLENTLAGAILFVGNTIESEKRRTSEKLRSGLYLQGVQICSRT